MQEIQVRSLVRKILLRRKWQPNPVFLPRKSHGQDLEELGGLQSRGSQRVRHDLVTKYHPRHLLQQQQSLKSWIWYRRYSFKCVVRLKNKEGINRGQKPRRTRGQGTCLEMGRLGKIPPWEGKRTRKKFPLWMTKQKSVFMRIWGLNSFYIQDKNLK